MISLLGKDSDRNDVPFTVLSQLIRWFDWVATQAARPAGFPDFPAFPVRIPRF